MDKIIIEDMCDVAEMMVNEVGEGNEATFIGLYYDVSELIRELIIAAEGEIDIERIDLEPEIFDGYDKEYYVSLNKNCELWCCKAYCSEIGHYLFDETGVVFIADDCNSKILEFVDYDKIFEVGFEDEEPECNGDCENCQNNIPDRHEVITRVATDKSGKLRGFERSWESKEDGMTFHSTYSFYSSDEKMLQDMLDNFKIKF